MQGLSYYVDLVMCIDATGSMQPVIDKVKEHAANFHNEVRDELKKQNKEITQMRVKLLVFRDLFVDGNKSIIETSFFPEQEMDQLSDKVKAIRADGGGDEPENGLEALGLAMNSDWTSEGDRQRHVIVLWTDASTHKLEDADEAARSYLPREVPQSLDDLTDQWQSQYVSSASKRLLLFAPDAYPWSTLAEDWDWTLHYPSKAGRGIEEVDYQTMLDMIVQSVG